MEASYPYKVVPIQCVDGSQITCTYYPISERRKSLIMLIEFEQLLTGDADEAIYIKPLLEFLMEEFETPMLEDKDYTYDPVTAVTYNEAMQNCEDFLAGTSRDVKFLITLGDGFASPVTMKKETDEGDSLSVSLLAWHG